MKSYIRQLFLTSLKITHLKYDLIDFIIFVVFFFVCRFFSNVVDENPSIYPSIFYFCFAVHHRTTNRLTLWMKNIRLNSIKKKKSTQRKSDMRRLPWKKQSRWYFYTIWLLLLLNIAIKYKMFYRKTCFCLKRTTKKIKVRLAETSAILALKCVWVHICLSLQVIKWRSILHQACSIQTSKVFCKE